MNFISFHGNIHATVVKVPKEWKGESTLTFPHPTDVIAGYTAFRRS